MVVEFELGGGVEVKTARHARCALLIFSVRLEALAESGKSIRAHISDKYACDVFVLGRRVDNETESVVRQVFPDAAAVVVEEQPTKVKMRQTIRTFRNVTLLRKICSHSNILHPGTMNGIRWRERGYHLVKKFEREKDIRYEWLVFLRPDYEFFANVPPFEMLAADKIHFSTRTTWGGIPGGFAICPRRLCAAYGEAYSGFKDGTIALSLKKANLLLPQSCRNSEILLYNSFMASEVNIGWFSSTGALLCVKNLCKDGDQCHKQPKVINSIVY